MLRRALSDNQVVMYLGFAEASAVAELESSLRELEVRRDEAERELAALHRERESLMGAPPAAPDPGFEAGPRGTERLRLEELNRRIDEASALLGRIEKKIAAAARAFPLYKEALAIDGRTAELRARRDHPAHKLLRRMYHENWSS